ncbi:MAG: pyridoxal phosphate-dependent aminotransferase, partial [Spirochaetales bacterium]|nr:pyridoxal phosphate-dependent aminotransferase [Spirochaetales bacterium]
MSDLPPLEAALALKRTHPDFLDLTDSRFHQNGFVPPFSVIRQAFEDYSKQPFYAPDSKGRLNTRETISRFYQTLGFDLSPDDILLTAGTSESYQHLFQLFCPRGGTIALPRPGYPLFEHLASERQTAFYNLEFSRSWQIDPHSLESIPKANLIVLISPNNPTGSCLNTESLAAVRAFCQRTGALWISDEVFDLFTGTEHLLRPGAVFQELPGFTLNGISKRFACPDWKLSWIALTGSLSQRRDAAEALEFINDLYLTATSFSQLLAERLFEKLGPSQKLWQAHIEENRAWLSHWAANLPVKGCFSLGGIYVPLQLETPDDEAFVLQALEQENLFLHPGFYYDFPPGESWVVVSLLKESAAFRQRLELLPRLICT